jgi:phosphoribosylanthranilate isomerase
MNERDEKLLSDIIGVAAEAGLFVKDIDLEGFLADKLLQPAIERLMMIVGEASWQMSPLFRASFSGVLWADIIGMRHRLVHGYATVDPRIVFRTAQVDLPHLVSAVSRGPFFIKVCGIRDPGTAEIAIAAGATCLGLVFHPKSPRNINLVEAASLTAEIAGAVPLTVLMVDTDDDGLVEVIKATRPSFIQLHGLETPRRASELRRLGTIPIIKAIGISSPADLAVIADYTKVADAILLDAKPPKDAAYPGGHGRPFDWSILKEMDPKQPFILSGGLTPENVAEAITTVRGYGLNLIGVDVSSGVESAPGVKDAAKIQSFVAAARGAASAGPS